MDQNRPSRLWVGLRIEIARAAYRLVKDRSQLDLPYTFFIEIDLIKSDQ
jgi:hypothetical protein